MNQSLTFAVLGAPRPKERPRLSRHGMVYTPKATKDYEQSVRVTAMRALSQWRLENDGAHWNAQGPFSLSVFFFMADKRKRDLDNCMKSVSDALNKLLYADDSQLDELYAFRDYDNRNPRAVVTVRRLREGE